MPQSIALLHYPYLVYRGEKKMLWDPVRRQTFKVRPEERVRQRLLNCFIQEGLYPKSRILTESGMESVNSSSERTDILCYDQAFTPHLLVECKAENVKITEQAAIQIARYNRQINAPLLLLTNGVHDYWYRTDDSSSRSLDDPPSSFVLHPSEPPTHYWIDRGFLGGSSPQALNDMLAKILYRYWIKVEQSKSSVTYLDFRRHPENLNLNHYYRVRKVQEEPSFRVALAFIQSGDSHSHLAAILNRDKENIGFIDINLTFVSQQKNESMWVYTEGKKDVFCARQTLAIKLDQDRWFDALHERIVNWYIDTYTAT